MSACKVPGVSGCVSGMRTVGFSALLADDSRQGAPGAVCGQEPKAPAGPGKAAGRVRGRFKARRGSV